VSPQDKSLQCADCGATFTFSAEEQELFQSRGYTNEPKRCPDCRQVTEPHARCSRQPAPSAVKPLKSLFSLAVISPFTAAIATEKSDQPDN
jgi:NAD-dependent SIR2 family protein deacetylase